MRRTRPRRRGRTPIGKLAQRWSGPIFEWHIPRGAGVVGVSLLLLASLSYGAVRGEHMPVVMAELRDARDAVANMFGFRLATIALSGERQLGRDKILAAAGVTERTSLLFLDATETRARLKGNPWIAEATVQKFYPSRLQIAVTERKAFALWQTSGNVAVIADDGTVLEPASRGFASLPLVVGAGAQDKAKDFLALLDRYPLIRNQMRASVLVADRRWNVKLANGINVRLPEKDAERALDILVQLDRDKKILSRDITVIDLRLPDRVVVRLSDEAAQAREEQFKPAKPKRKAGDV